jgi:hypothetical protein
VARVTVRLGLGIEPVDAVRGGRIGHPLTVAVDGVPLPPARLRRDPGASPWTRQDVLERLPRTDACRFRLLLRPGLKPELPVRLWDDARRYVPRRLEVAMLNLALNPPEERGRIVRPALFPGAAYGAPAGAVGCRGTVTRGVEPLRWARVEATVGGVVVGRAHGDDRGEFLLLLGPEAATGPDLEFPIDATVTVFGPDPPPPPGPESALDPLWDLPLEAVPAAGAEAVLAGTAHPPGYRPAAVPRVVSFGPDGLRGETFVFT